MGKRKHQSAYRKATDALEAEGRKQCFIIYGASAIALWRHHGKRQQAITRLFESLPGSGRTAHGRISTA